MSPLTAQPAFIRYAEMLFGLEVSPKRPALKCVGDGAPRPSAPYVLRRNLMVLPQMCTGLGGIRRDVVRRCFPRLETPLTKNLFRRLPNTFVQNVGDVEGWEYSLQLLQDIVARAFLRGSFDCCGRLPGPFA